MKFYKCDFEYTAIIWAKHYGEAISEYNKTIGKTKHNDNPRPDEIDVDEVLQMMIDGGFDGDRESMAIGQIGELYKIITSKEPIVVLHNCQ